MIIHFVVNFMFYKKPMMVFCGIVQSREKIQGLGVDPFLVNFHSTKSTLSFVYKGWLFSDKN